MEHERSFHGITNIYNYYTTITTSPTIRYQPSVNKVEKKKFSYTKKWTDQ